MASIREYVRVPRANTTNAINATKSAGAIATDVTAIVKSINSIVRSIIEADRQAKIAQEELEQSNLTPMTSATPAFDDDARADAAAALATGLKHLENAGQMFKAARTILSQSTAPVGVEADLSEF